LRLATLVPSLSLLYALLFTPTLVRAQFQPPNPDELKMTDDPKAPGAAAVYLDREETTDDATRFWTRYERIKVLTEKGKELATVRVAYSRSFQKVSEIDGRTIHADGTIVPLTAKPADLMDFKVKDFQVDTVVFTLPGVEVGSILEYRIKLHSSDNELSRPVWGVQLPYFIRKAHFSFHPLTQGIAGVYENGRPVTRINFTSHLGLGEKVNYLGMKDTYVLDLTDIPPSPAEDWMPPLNTVSWGVEFYYTNAITGPAFWADAGQHWAEFVQQFTAPTPAIKKAAADLVLPADTDEQKARKIYAAVLKLENTTFGHTKTEAERKAEKLKDIRSAEDIWKYQSGNKNEITMLFVALGRAAGLKTWPIQIVPRNHRIFDNTFLTLRQLEDYLAIVELNGKDVYLDPGQKVAPFGALSWPHYLAGGFRMAAGGATSVLTPGNNYKTAVLQRVAQLFIDPSGSLTGSVRFILSGPEALSWRQASLENDQDEVKKRFNESLKDAFPAGVQADFDHFLALDDYTVNLVAIVKVSGNIASVTAKRLILPGVFFQSRSRHPFTSQEARTTPIDVHFAKTEEDDVTYHLPAGVTVESAPPPASAAWPDHAVLKIVSKADGGSVNVLRTLVYNFTLLDSKDYGSLHDFYLKVATADQEQLVLAHAPAVQGN